MRIGLEFGNDPAGAPRIPPATFAGIARSVKIANVRWSDCEPTAWPSWWPFPRYSFGWLIKQLDAWRAAGFDYVTMVVKCAHPSYTAATYTPPPGFASGFLGIASAPPKDAAAWKALDAWARALVRAVRGRAQVIECESEWQSPAWWLGGLDEYMRWLGVLDSAIHAEAPEIKLCLGGHSLDGLLDDDPDDDEFNARIDGPGSDSGAGVCAGVSQIAAGGLSADFIQGLRRRQDRQSAHRRAPRARSRRHRRGWRVEDQGARRC